MTLKRKSATGLCYTGTHPITYRLIWVLIVPSSVIPAEKVKADPELAELVEDGGEGIINWIWYGANCAAMTYPTVRSNLSVFRVTLTIDLRASRAIAHY